MPNEVAVMAKIRAREIARNEWILEVIRVLRSKKVSNVWCVKRRKCITRKRENTCLFNVTATVVIRPVWISLE